MAFSSAHPKLLGEAVELADLLRPDWARRLALLHASGVPLNEGEGEGSAGGEGEGSGGDAGGEGEGSAGGEGEGSGDGDGEGDNAPTALERENQALKRRLRDADKAKTRAERALRQKTEKERTEQGEYKTMFEEADARARALETKIREDALNRVTVSAASKQRFINPELVPALVKVDDAVDEDGNVDEALVESAVKALAKRESYLVREPEKPQGTVRGDRVRANGSGDGSPPEVEPGIGRLRHAYGQSPTQRSRQ